MKRLTLILMALIVNLNAHTASIIRNAMSLTLFSRTANDTALVKAVFEEKIMKK